MRMAPSPSHGLSDPLLPGSLGPLTVGLGAGRETCGCASGDDTTMLTSVNTSIRHHVESSPETLAGSLCTG